jgi:uncharacterized spore protein YtfJ
MADAITRATHMTLAERLAEKLGASIQATTIFAPPVERDGRTVIPVARAAWGFGGGGGSGGNGALRRGQGSGGGGGARINPIGYIEISDEGTRFRHIFDARTILTLTLGGGMLALLLLREVRKLVGTCRQDEAVVATVVDTETTDIPQDANFSEAPVG